MADCLPVGPVMWTGSRYLDAVDPNPDDFDIGEIMTALCRIRRYNGLGTRQPWTVGQHSLLCHRFAVQDGVTEPLALLTIVLHDAPEAYLGDMIQPVKQGLPEYKQREHRFWAGMCRRWGMPIVLPEIVHHYDRLALSSEKAALIAPEAGDWPNLPKPRPLPPEITDLSDEEVWFDLMMVVGCYLNQDEMSARISRICST